MDNDAVRSKLIGLLMSDVEPQSDEYIKISNQIISEAGGEILVSIFKEHFSASIADDSDKWSLDPLAIKVDCPLIPNCSVTFSFEDMLKDMMDKVMHSETGQSHLAATSMMMKLTAKRIDEFTSVYGSDG